MLDEFEASRVLLGNSKFRSPPVILIVMGSVLEMSITLRMLYLTRLCIVLCQSGRVEAYDLFW